MGLKRLGAIAAGLALFYSLNGPPKNIRPPMERYNVPQEISVMATDLPATPKEKLVAVKDNKGGLEYKIEREFIVKTSEIDNAKHFYIKTDRYKLIKNDDWLITQGIGHVFSLPTKLFFWDHRAGLGLDEDKTKEVVAMLENHKEIRDLTVRINHNNVFNDWYRMMTQKDLTKRNPFVHRLVVGTYSAVMNELWAGGSRGDYYNPLTRTTVLYSGIEGVSAHEIGHCKDFSRFRTDWMYQLSRYFPPVTLYQEWKASTNAKDILSQEDAYQFNRYLIPAFATYCYATYLGTRRTIQKFKKWWNS